MNTFDKMLANKAAMIPTSGVNLVCFDDFEAPGEQLSLVANYPDENTASAALVEREKQYPGNKYFLYKPGDA